jgi:triosephosphate isomerase
MKKLIVGNWKMNMDTQGAKALAQTVAAGATGFVSAGRVDLAVCPVMIHIEGVVAGLKDFPVQALAVGAQDCSDQEDGAYTGQVSAAMLKDAGCSFVIVGHSERRQYNKESSALVAAKAAKALEAGLTPIICVGETLEQRDSGKEQDVVAYQLAHSIPAGASGYVVAYEPVWAIGTGKVASPEDVAKMHAFIRTQVGGDVLILYGGSMKPDNAKELLATPNVDGGLIGGASLKAEEFLAIASCV